MKSIRNIFHIWYDELADMFKDKGILIFVIFVPLFYPLLYSWVYTNEVVREVPAAVVDDSRTTQSREFIRMVDATPDVDVVAHCTTVAEAEELLRRREAFGIIRIPESFTKDIWHGDQTVVGIYSDMSSMLYYKALLLATTKVSLEMNADIKVERHMHGTTDRQDEIQHTPIEYDYVALYNPQSGFAAFLIPPVLMLILQQTLLLGIGMSAGRMRERFRGSLVPFHHDYKNPVYIVLGKAAAYFGIYIVMAVYAFTIVTHGFSLPQLGDLATLTAFVVPFLLACIFLAMVLSSLVWRREDCILLFVCLSVPLLFISGISWPGAAVPAFWKAVSCLFPSTFGMNGYVRIQSMGATLSDVAFELRGLWIQAGVYFLLACLIYRRQIKLIANRYYHK
ncbi:MAG: ABC transporter permease [Alistipes sp.]|uniref:ABC transporter permease n=1 Tax=Butyricimonas TaxID=574697 RepID=UPI0027BAE1B3|nr:ABC transporter permease [Odoribacter splanchnicus]